MPYTLHLVIKAPAASAPPPVPPEPPRLAPANQAPAPARDEPSGALPTGTRPRSRRCDSVICEMCKGTRNFRGACGRGQCKARLPIGEFQREATLLVESSAVTVKFHTLDCSQSAAVNVCCGLARAAASGRGAPQPVRGQPGAGAGVQRGAGSHRELGAGAERAALCGEPGAAAAADAAQPLPAAAAAALPARLQPGASFFKHPSAECTIQQQGHPSRPGSIVLERWNCGARTCSLARHKTASRQTPEQGPAHSVAAARRWGAGAATLVTRGVHGDQVKAVA